MQVGLDFYLKKAQSVDAIINIHSEFSGGMQKELLLQGPL